MPNKTSPADPAIEAVIDAFNFVKNWTELVIAYDQYQELGGEVWDSLHAKELGAALNKANYAARRSSRATECDCGCGSLIGCND